MTNVRRDRCTTSNRSPPICYPCRALPPMRGTYAADAPPGGGCRTQRGHTMLELAFSWLAGRPQVSSVIAGATRVEQIEQNVKAIAWKLSADEMAEIDKITQG